MKFELLVIGNELLKGKISDKNGTWLAQWLQKRHLDLNYWSYVPDDEASLLEAFQLAFSRSQIVITSGGLGPTLDDVTKKAIAKFFNKSITHSELAQIVAQTNYDRFQKHFDPTHNAYNFLPEGFTPVNNPCGLAPGLFFRHLNATFFAAPGVPSEFQAMVEHELWPLIEPKQNQKKVRESLCFRSRLVPEEKIFTQLCPDLWEKLSQWGPVSSLPHPMGVDVGVSFEASRPQELQEKKEAIIKYVLSTALAPSLWQIGEESLENLVLKKMHQKGLTLALAESCTGGLVSSRLTDIPGSSSVFWGSVVSYDNQVKKSLLGVSEETLLTKGAVSEETAKQMAIGARERLGAHIGLSLTGIAGPGGGSPEKPVGSVWIGLSDKKTTRAFFHQLKGDRISLKFKFSQMALFHLLDLTEQV